MHAYVYSKTLGLRFEAFVGGEFDLIDIKLVDEEFDFIDVKLVENWIKSI